MGTRRTIIILVYISLCCWLQLVASHYTYTHFAEEQNETAIENCCSVIGDPLIPSVTSVNAVHGIDQYSALSYRAEPIYSCIATDTHPKDTRVSFSASKKYIHFLRRLII